MPKEQAKQKPSVRSQIREYGSNNNISKKELLKISQNSEVGVDRVVRQIDNVNSKLTSSKKAPIGLGSAAANAYSKGKLGPVNNPFWVGGKSGAGPIATALGQMMDRTTGSMLSQGQGVRTIPGTGLIPKGQQIIGSYNGAPQLQIKPALQGRAGTSTKPSTGSTGGTTGEEPDQTTPKVEDTLTDTPITDAAAATTDNTAGPEMLSGGGAGINSATGIRRRRSSWMTQGKSTRGTSNFNRNLTISGYNMN